MSALLSTSGPHRNTWRGDSGSHEPYKDKSSLRASQGRAVLYYTPFEVTYRGYVKRICCHLFVPGRHEHFLEVALFRIRSIGTRKGFTVVVRS